jgi:hypothetical protein
LPEGYALVECKHWRKAVGAGIIREFAGRCIIRGAGLGILVTRNGISGKVSARSPLAEAQLERRMWLARGVHILVLTAADLRGKSRDLRALGPLLRADFERLRFGERA